MCSYWVTKWAQHPFSTGQPHGDRYRLWTPRSKRTKVKRSSSLSRALQSLVLARHRRTLRTTLLVSWLVEFPPNEKTILPFSLFRSSLDEPPKVVIAQYRKSCTTETAGIALNKKWNETSVPQVAARPVVEQVCPSCTNRYHKRSLPSENCNVSSIQYTTSRLL